MSKNSETQISGKFKLELELGNDGMSSLSDLSMLLMRLSVAVLDLDPIRPDGFALVTDCQESVAFPVHHAASDINGNRIGRARLLPDN